MVGWTRETSNCGVRMIRRRLRFVIPKKSRMDNRKVTGSGRVFQSLHCEVAHLPASQAGAPSGATVDREADGPVKARKTSSSEGRRILKSSRTTPWSSSSWPAPRSASTLPLHAYADLPKITIHLQVALTECLQELGRTLEVGRVGNPHL